ncbi:metal-dependent transcriptional regulator [Flammeovirga kamogawensis]|uniref:Metal-dependent transcriptional regulator n=1 Tax=Flammeovirga kamogawensis TaxID=373891 RepID=A0ABX8GYR2_9BACT|nr:metal-dependent transcriptional regulator [Flammeovirga kamogawensis]MBB6460721.1 DtxR family Mn-dependent transcriptional regulator [Flammeovirga kamogawensis]QWG08075.1 metal-dependent transcriptional regulator [Flammeovirga kamogawensis]TRX69880.1 metal-dependent transcriptional regulator [Flammeovirga kamogawensis]
MKKLFNWLGGLSNNKLNINIIKEDLLKTLFKNEEVLSISTSITLGNQLEYSDEQIAEALKLLIQEEKISTDNDSYKLLESGTKDALQLIRRHRLYEKYLAEKTGFSKVNWHRKAEEMEHHLTNDEVEKMAKELGNPRFDPHGDPIPTKEGILPKLKGIPLSDVKQNAIVKILHIEDEPRAVYKELIRKGIHIGSIMAVDLTTSVYSTEGHGHHFSKDEMKNITVLVIEETEDIPKGVVRLTTLKLGEKAIITGLSQECRGANRRRLLDLGFVKGSKIKINMVSPLSDPKAFLIRETLIALRKEQTDMILIKKIDAE